MTNGSDFAFNTRATMIKKTSREGVEADNPPLNKREYFAAMAMQGMCSRQPFVFEGMYEQIAKQAVLAADYLIEELNKNN